MSITVAPAAIPVAPPVAPAGNEARLRAAAEAMEASFLSVMLQSAGLGAPREGMGGGIGEEQFASFLAEAHAEALVRRGGIGLAESLFAALQARGAADTGPAAMTHSQPIAGAQNVRV